MTQSPPPPVENRADDGTLSDSDRYRLLASEMRRLALDVLDDRTAELHLAHLARGVTVRLEEDVDGEATRRVALLLHHHHLPMLADHGVVRYDRDAKLIRCDDERVGALID